jgi:hypothetical protein
MIRGCKARAWYVWYCYCRREGESEVYVTGIGTVTVYEKV